jgi:hypothetical protein
VVSAIYLHEEQKLDGYYVAPDPILGEEDEDQEVEPDDEDEMGNEDDEGKGREEDGEYQPNVTFMCSSCSWHPSTFEEWNSFVMAEDQFCDTSPETLPDYRLWTAQNFTIQPTSTPPLSSLSLPIPVPPSIRIHPSHYLIFRLEDNLTRLSLEDLMDQGEEDGQGQEQSNYLSRQSSLEDTLTLLLEMMSRLNSLSAEIVPPVLHEKIIYWDRIGQTAIALADHLSHNFVISSDDEKTEKQRLAALETAQKAFQEAYTMSKLTCGEDCGATHELKILAGEVPS